MTLQSMIIFPAHVMLLLLLALFCHQETPIKALFDSVLAAQFALLGVWMALADRWLPQRVALGLLGAFGLCMVAFSVSNFNGWQLTMAAVRLVLIAAVLGRSRWKQGMVIRRSAQPTNVRLFRVTLLQLLLIAFVWTLFLLVLRALKHAGGEFYDALLVTMVVIVGIIGATTSLIAAMATLGQFRVATMGLAAFAIMAIAAGMAAFAYQQTNSWQVGWDWFVIHMIEATYVTLSLMAVRGAGYQLVTDPSHKPPKRPLSDELVMQ